MQQYRRGVNYISEILIREGTLTMAMRHTFPLCYVLCALIIMRHSFIDHNAIILPEYVLLWPIAVSKLLQRQINQPVSRCWVNVYWQCRPIMCLMITKQYVKYSQLLVWNSCFDWNIVKFGNQLQQCFVLLTSYVLFKSCSLVNHFIIRKPYLRTASNWSHLVGNGAYNSLVMRILQITKLKLSDDRTIAPIDSIIYICLSFKHICASKLTIIVSHNASFF